MRVKTLLLCAISFVALMADSSAASAAELVITYYGSISRGFDEAGDFGTPNTDLTGQRFIATYVYQPSDASYFAATDRRWNETVSGGGKQVNASITIGGKTVAVPDVTYSSFSFFRLGNENLTEITTYADGERYTPSTLEASFFNIQTRITDGFPFPSVGNFFYTSDSLNDSGVYSRQRFSFDYSQGYRQLKHEQTYSFAYFAYDRLTILSTGAVPEPATWMTMILGFGLVGYSLRKRQAIKTAVRFA